MSVHELLVRYAGGHFIRTATGGTGPGGREYLELGQVESLAEAQGIADLELERMKAPLEAITAEPNPRATVVADRPLLGWREGDYVNTLDRAGAATVVRVRELEVGQDNETGEVTVTPALASRLEEQDARLERIIRRRLNGTLAGRSATTGSAQPADSVRIRQVGKASETFNWSGTVADLVDQINGPKQFEIPGRLAQIKYTWTTPPPTNDASVIVYRNGTSWATHTLPAGRRTYRVFPNALVDRWHWYDMAVASVDAAAEGLTAEWTVVYFT